MKMVLILSFHNRVLTHSLPLLTSEKVYLRFLASPINPADINQVEGVYPLKPTFTKNLGTEEEVAVGGNEGVAEIIAIGDNVKSLQVGDWVVMGRSGFGEHLKSVLYNVRKILNFVFIWHYLKFMCSIFTSIILKNFGYDIGTWRTHAIANEEEVQKISHDGLSIVQAATLAVNPCTAYRMLKDFVMLKEGISTLVFDLPSN